MDSDDRIKHVKKISKENLIAGLVVLLPIYVTFIVMKWLLGSLGGFYDSLPEVIKISGMIDIPGAELVWNFVLTIILLGIVTAVGFASRNLLFAKTLQFFESLVKRLPVLRSVYSGVGQVMRASFGKGANKSFSRVVMLEWPHKDMWTLAFVTGEFDSQAVVPGFSDKDELLLNVYVPTTPNPTGGYWVVVPAQKTQKSSLSVDEAFRMILSLGILAASEEPKTG